MLRNLLLAMACMTFQTGNAKAQDCEPMIFARYLAPGPQDFEPVEKIALDRGRELLAVRFGELKGPFAKLYLFLEWQDGCMFRAVSAGSYEATNAASQDGRIYHIDLYDTSIHATLSMSDEPPTYEEVRQMALDSLR